MDRAERLAVVQEAQRYIYDQVPVIRSPIPGWLQAYRTDRFENWQPSPGPNGYLLPSYNYQSLLKIRPVAGSTGATTSGLPGWTWAAGSSWSPLVAVVLVFRGRGRRRARRPEPGRVEIGRSTRRSSATFVEATGRAFGMPVPDEPSLTDDLATLEADRCFAAYRRRGDRRHDRHVLPAHARARAARRSRPRGSRRSASCPTHRRRGILTELMTLALEQASERGEPAQLAARVRGARSTAGTGTGSRAGTGGSTSTPPGAPSTPYEPRGPGRGCSRPRMRSNRSRTSTRGRRRTGPGRRR